MLSVVELQVEAVVNTLKNFNLLMISGGIFAISACSVPDEPTEIHDPYESVNRVSHAVNKGADMVFFRPVSKVYGTVVPNPVRTGLSNVASNLDTPRSMVNDILQGDIEGAGHNFFRFVMNTIFGLGGILDPATDMGLEERETGFGETLHVWGASEGAYLELPLFGPSNERDAVGQVFDIIANPLTFLGDEGAEATTLSSLPSVLNSRYELGESVDGILYDSADSYVQLRLFYLQNRRFQLSGQASADNVFDPYEDLYEDVYIDLYDDLGE